MNITMIEQINSETIVVIIWLTSYTPISTSLNNIMALTTGMAKNQVSGLKFGKVFTSTVGRITTKYEGPI